MQTCTLSSQQLQQYLTGVVLIPPLFAYYKLYSSLVPGCGITYRVAVDDGGVECGERVVADPRQSAEDVRREEMIVKCHSITLQLSVHTRHSQPSAASIVYNGIEY